MVLTNCSNNYGPWQFPEKLIPVVILKAAVGDWLYVGEPRGCPAAGGYSR